MLKKLMLLASILYLLLTPITFHPDNKLVLFWGSLDNGNVWNIYEYGEKHLTESGKPQFNYPPVHFLLVKLQYLIAEPLGGEGYSDWLSSDNATDAGNPYIFRYALATKLPLVFVTLINGLLLYLVVKKHGGDRPRALMAASLWWFNPIVIYSGVLMGQNDVLAIMPFLLGWYFLNSRTIFSIILFGLATSVKNYPLMWVGLLVIMQPGFTWIKKAGVIFGSILVYFLTTLPFLGNSVFQNAVLNSSINERIFIPRINLGLGDEVIIVPALLTIVLLFAVNFAKKNTSLGNRCFVVLAATMTILGFSHFHPQWFTWLIPFWAIWMVWQKNLTMFTNKLIISLVVFFAWIMVLLLFKDIYLYWGILSPINPGLMNLPFLPDFLTSRGIDAAQLNNFAHSVLAGSALAAIISLGTKTRFVNDKTENIANKFLEKMRGVLVKLGKRLNILTALILSLLLPILLLMIIFTMTNTIPSQRKFSNYNSFSYLNVEYPQTASFSGKLNYLNRVDIMMRNPGLASQEKMTVVVSDATNEIVSKEFVGMNVGDPGIVRVDLPIQLSSSTNKYTVQTIRADSDEKILKLAMNNGELAFDQYYEPPVSLNSVFQSTIERVSTLIWQLPLWFAALCLLSFAFLLEIGNISLKKLIKR